MARAIWNDKVLAESDAFETVEGNIYFPPDSINREFFRESDHQTTCPWKGEANYYSIVTKSTTLENAVWTYETPKPDLAEIAGHLAFYATDQVAIEQL